MCKVIDIVLFKRGTEVFYEGHSYTVDHITLSEGNLYVNLNGIDGRIRADKLFGTPTRLLLGRAPKPNTAAECGGSTAGS